MAGSRVYRIGTVFSRTEALLKSKAIPAESKPIWFDIYEKFPPKYSPEYGRATPNMELRKIFYEEDVLRARIHKEHQRETGLIDLGSKGLTKSQNCVHLYRNLLAEGKSSQEAMDEAIKKTYKKRQEMNYT